MEQGIYPLLLDGEQAGTMKVYAEGAWTVFDVQCAMRPGILRVSVYGGGREGYLGVLAPEGEGLALCRRLSPSALRGFPTQIEYAGRAGEAVVGRDDPGAPEPVGRDAQIAPPEETLPAPEPAPEPEAATETETETPPDIEDLYWYASPDGALVCFDGAENLLALPVGDPRIPADGGWKKTIEGRDYVVFRTKNGRVIY